MKKLTTSLVLAMLCLNFAALAQENIVNRGLQPGQQVPSTAGLDTYKGQVLILDFWATWCAPCRAVIPKSDSLNAAFQGKALILPVTYETEKLAGPVLAQVRKGRHPATPEIYNDQVLQKLFPHQALPHYVWIDPKGKVRAFTEATAINAAALTKAIGENQYPQETKQDLRIPYTSSQPLFTAGNGGSGVALRYHSLLSGFVPGLDGGLEVSPYDTVRGQQFTARNVPLLWLFRLAYSEQGRWFSNARIRNLSRDSASMRTRLSGQAYNQWLGQGFGYCYELLLPPALAQSAYPLMQADMARLFPQYSVSVEKTRTRCLALVKTGSDTLFRSKSSAYLVQVTPFACRLQNATLGQLLMRLDRQFLQHAAYPLVDLTGYTGRADLNFKADMTSVASINQGLAPYGLQLREQLAETELLLVRDHPLPSKPNPKPL